jgi:hypothetical protein
MHVRPSNTPRQTRFGLFHVARNELTQVGELASLHNVTKNPVTLTEKRSQDAAYSGG